MTRQFSVASTPSDERVVRFRTGRMSATPGHAWDTASTEWARTPGHAWDTASTSELLAA